jgi:lipopolysaccharide transport protein LptA
MNATIPQNHTRAASLLLPAAILGLALLAPACAKAETGAAKPPPAAGDVKPAAPETAAPKTEKPKEEKGNKLFPDLGPGGTVQINADSMDMDMARHISTFTGNVVVTDPRMTLKADKMVVTFDAQEKPQVIVAEGNVVIDQPAADRHAKAGRAEYDVVKGVIVLTEKPVLTAGANTMIGSAKITYDRDAEHISCEGQAEPGKQPTIVVTPSKDGKDASNPLNPKKTEKNDK